MYGKEMAREAAFFVCAPLYAARKNGMITT